MTYPYRRDIFEYGVTPLSQDMMHCDRQRYETRPIPTIVPIVDSLIYEKNTRFQRDPKFCRSVHLMV